MTRQSLRAFFTTGVFATSLLASSTAMAAVDMFLRMDNVTGESTDAKHAGAMDVLAWSWGQSSGAARTTRTLPAVCIQDLSLTKYIDSASPELIMNSLVGEVAPEAVLKLVRRAGGSSTTFLTLTMRNVTVAAYSTGGSGGEDRLTENVVLHFESMQGSYQKQNSDGSPSGAPITFDIPAGASTCR